MKTQYIVLNNELISSPSLRKRLERSGVSVRCTNLSTYEKAGFACFPLLDMLKMMIKTQSYKLETQNLIERIILNVIIHWSQFSGINNLRSN